MNALGLTALLLLPLSFADDDEKPLEDQVESAWDFIAKKYDKNGNGFVTPEEYGRSEELFARLDVDKDGIITPDDLAGRRKWSMTGERPEAPKVGEKAPTFELEILTPPKKPLVGNVVVADPKKTEKDEKKPKKVKLADFKGKKPVALIFGSYT